MSTQQRNLGPAPAKIHGSSLSAVYAQRQADENLERLLRSEERGAPAKAFAQGLLAGTVLPTALALAPWALGSVQADVQADKQRAHLAHMLKSQGMEASKAHAAAAGALRYLQNVDSISDETKDMLSAGSKQYALRPDLPVPEQFRGAVWNSPADLMDDLKISPEVAKKVIVEVGAGPLPQGAQPTARQASRILESASDSFYRAAASNPDMMKDVSEATSAFRSLKGALRKTLPATIPLGILAGIGAARNVQNHRREIKGLREKVAEQQPGVLERGMQAAPAMAALPGFAVGAADPHVFDPQTLLGSRATQVLGHPRGLKSRLVSGVIGAGAASSAAALPGVLHQGYKALRGTPAPTATAPIIIQKQANVGQHMLAELERIYGDVS